MASGTWRLISKYCSSIGVSFGGMAWGRVYPESSTDVGHRHTDDVYTSRVTELTLDPQSWSDLRALGHRMLDDMFEYLETVRERPVWQSVPPAVRERLDSPLPTAGRTASAVYDDFKELILPYPTGNIHPRFWGWVMGTGSPLAMLAA